MNNECKVNFSERRVSLGRFGWIWLGLVPLHLVRFRYVKTV